MTEHSILLIEDDPAVAHSLQDALGREGYPVLWFPPASKVCASPGTPPPG